jgi:EpsI family protein
LITANVLVRSNDAAWKQTVSEVEALDLAGSPMTVRRAELSGKDRRLLVFSWYWVDGRSTANDHLAKLFLVWPKLRGHADDCAVVMIYAAVEEHEEALEMLQTFAREMSSVIAQTLINARAML